MEESVYGGGYLRGFIDCDFLKPLPARSGFEENEDWIGFLDELDRLRPALEAEVESLKQREAAIKLTEIHKKAIELAKEILNAEEFKALELLDGMGRKSPEALVPPNGFDFVPSSARVGIGERKALALKACVPGRAPDRSRVFFSVDDAPAINLLMESARLEAARANKEGVVTIHAQVEGKARTVAPVILTARAGALRAEYRVRVEDPREGREPTGPGSEKQGPWITYEELPFDEGPARHSRYAARKVQINTRNPDYCREVPGKPQLEQLAYTILICSEKKLSPSRTRARRRMSTGKTCYRFTSSSKAGSPAARPP